MSNLPLTEEQVSKVFESMKILADVYLTEYQANFDPHTLKSMLFNTPVYLDYIIRKHLAIKQKYFEEDSEALVKELFKNWPMVVRLAIYYWPYNLEQLKTDKVFDEEFVNARTVEIFKGLAQKYNLPLNDISADTVMLFEIFLQRAYFNVEDFQQTLFPFGILLDLSEHIYKHYQDYFKTELRSKLEEIYQTTYDQYKDKLIEMIEVIEKEYYVNNSDFEYMADIISSTNVYNLSVKRREELIERIWSKIESQLYPQAD